MSWSIIYRDLIIHWNILYERTELSSQDRSAPPPPPPPPPVRVCTSLSVLPGENLLISLITSNFTEICQGADHAEGEGART